MVKVLQGVICLFLTALAFNGLAKEPITVGERHTFSSAILDEDLRISVYLPRSYNRTTDSKYDVLYLLDGGANLLHTAGSQYFLAGYRQMPELIIVGIHSNNRDRDYTPSAVDKFPSSGGAKPFRRFLTQELFEFVNENYRVTAKKYLSGHSYGGLFAIDTLTTNPAMFDAYFTFSPSLRWNNNKVLNNMIKKLEDNELNGYLYVNIGDEGLKLKKPILILHEALKQHAVEGFRWKVDWLENENHSTTPVIGQFLAYRDYFKRTN